MRSILGWRDIVSEGHDNGPMRLKYRTREHIIADLSVNHFERQTLFAGHASERVRCDYGYDLSVWTYKESGEIEPGQFFVQVKATDTIKLLSKENSIALRLDKRDLTLWLEEFLPVFLVLYDAHADVAYWMCVQVYFGALGDTFSLANIGQTYTVYFNPQDILDSRAIQLFAEYKRRVISQRKSQIGDIWYES
ncbi:MAG: DUF4365 domain-containing protein [Alkalinema sp. RU_4_3]|nr:DUF4365 domain-containing protein [Alkalinema sp. RU_4_3]